MAYGRAAPLSAIFFGAERGDLAAIGCFPLCQVEDKIVLRVDVQPLHRRAVFPILTTVLVSDQVRKNSRGRAPWEHLTLGPKVESGITCGGVACQSLRQSSSRQPPWSPHRRSVASPTLAG